MHQPDRRKMEAAANEHAIGMMLEVYKTVLTSEGALYFSVPITSGRRYIAWLERIGKDAPDIDGLDERDRASHYTEVVKPNRAHARQIIQRIRETTGRIVIDPTAMPPLTGWLQKDWRYFWRQVIERYAAAVVFVDDWQYSNGCVYEFWVAKKKGIPTMDERMRSLDLEQGVGLIVESSAETRRHGVPTIFIEQVLQDLEEFSPVLGGPSA
jgi:hypothetical protein